ncbi:MAG: glycosyltransferase family 39 protein [Parcubacteria group bacterium]|jgi:4-amino-4-deoxy-L-arabinose transferase-like glycosyltransferase
MEKIKNIPKRFWVLVAIVLVGIIFRTYDFHDGVRFNADQARDASLVEAVVNGEESWPLLGPKAGGTDFKLGPIFYEFQIVSALIFGSEPDKVAYPDLIFAILSIPLIYFLLKKYFAGKLALSLTALYAVSFYAIKYARFAWNPNSTPFWTMLFLLALLQIAEQQGKKKVVWSVVAGVAVGVGVQLHTFLLVVMPLLVIVYFAYLGLKEKKWLWKNFLFIVLASLTINVPQLYNETQTGGNNIKALFAGAEIKKEDKSIFLKIGRTGECFMTAGTFTVSSLGESDECRILPVKSVDHAIGLVLGGLLFFGGLGFGIWRTLKEPIEAKRRFLGLILAYTGFVVLFMVPVALELSLRYFLIIAFLPFVFLGLWLEFLTHKFRKKGVVIALAIIIVLAGINLWTTKNFFNAVEIYTEKTSMAGFDNVYLGELEMMADYIIFESDPSNQVFLDGNNQYMFKASKGLIYLAKKEGVDLQVLDKKNELPGIVVFNLISTEAKDRKIQSLEENFEILGFRSFGRFGLIKTRLK